MKMFKKRCLCCLCAALCLAGCRTSTENKTPTDQELEAFKGKPMPPEVAEKMKRATPARKANAPTKVDAATEPDAPAKSDKGNTSQGKKQ